MKTFEGVDVYIYVFLTAALIVGVVSFTPRPLYHLYPLEAGLAPESVSTTWRVEKSCPYLDTTSNPSAVQPEA
jgi:hypothetical protein